ncbi:MAG: YggS family pyridoxal phosphate-dependent enzyme, partial [Bacteroidota bacterium]
MVAENIKNIRERINRACFRCGRKPEEVTLVAVTKTFGSDMMKEAVDAGQLDFGENYVQELNEKRDELRNLNVRWHFIGHLQTNKVKYIAEYVHLVQTVDNVRVAEEIQKRAQMHGRIIDILVEVHTTTEETKSGVSPEKTLDLVKQISPFKNVRMQGLMTMGPFSDDPNDSRPSFQQLVHVQKRIGQEGIPGVSAKQLSMGMTHDFEVGIEEGATIVRLGTAIFG